MGGALVRGFAGFPAADPLEAHAVVLLESRICVFGDGGWKSILCHSAPHP